MYSIERKMANQILSVCGCVCVCLFQQPKKIDSVDTLYVNVAIAFDINSNAVQCPQSQQMDMVRSPRQ